MSVYPRMRRPQRKPHKMCGNVLSTMKASLRNICGHKRPAFGTELRSIPQFVNGGYGGSSFSAYVSLHCYQSTGLRNRQLGTRARQPAYETRGSFCAHHGQKRGRNSSSNTEDLQRFLASVQIRQPAIGEKNGLDHCFSRTIMNQCSARSLSLGAYQYTTAEVRCGETAHFRL